MSLAERLKKKQQKVERVTVDGDAYLVSSLSMADKGKLYQQARRKDGTIDTQKLETLMLVACVTGEDGSSATYEDWSNTWAYISGPLITASISACGMDKDDLKRDDPKDSGSTEN